MQEKLRKTWPAAQIHLALIAVAGMTILIAGLVFSRAALAGFEKSSVYWLAKGAPEIVAAAETPSGYVLAYTNSDEESVGFLGIDSVPGGGQPTEIAELDLRTVLPTAPQAEPTSVAATPDNRWFVIAVNTSLDAPGGGSGVAVVVDAALAAVGTPAVAATIPLPGQPDSVAASTRKSKYVAIAIENETVEDSGNNLGIGSLVVIQTKPRRKPAEWSATTVDLTGLDIMNPDDPEPEFVDVNDKNLAAVSLQENNAVVIVSLRSKKIKAVWDAGEANQIADITEDDIIDFGESIADSPRTPDGLAWTADGRVVLANEGEANLTGGRSLSVHDAKTGAIANDPGAALELQVVAHGHYNDGRSANKGAEFEGVETGVFRGREYIFGAAERGSGVTVQASTAGGYAFLQLLPMIGDSEPEGLLALPALDLLVAADEENGKIVFYEYGPVGYPNIVRPTPAEPATAGSIGWGALSGFSDGPEDYLCAVPDSAYRSSVYTLDVDDYDDGDTALIVGEIAVTDPWDLLPKNNFGQSYLADSGRALLDLEGIALGLDDDGVRSLKNGAWLVSEGEDRPDRNVRPNLLVRINAAGEITEVVRLPFPTQAIPLEDDNGSSTGETRQVSENINRFGFEGVTTTGKGEHELVYIAFQRTWLGDDPGIARIGVYQPSAESWSFYGYRLDEDANNPGLSEIVALDTENFAVIERDGANGSVEAPDLFKVVKVFSIADAAPTANPDGDIVALSPESVVTPVQVFDLVGTTPGDDLEKWEGLAVKDDTAYAVNDNDGAGETRLVTFDAEILSVGEDDDDEDDEGDDDGEDEDDDE